MNGNCVVESNLIEWLFGMTTIRAIKTANFSSPNLNPPLELPDYINYDLPKKLTKRHVDPDIDLSEASEVLADIAADLSMDLGEISASYVGQIVKMKAPKLLSMAVNNLLVKMALKELVMATMIRQTSRMLSIFGNIIGSTFTLYEIYISILNIVDVIRSITIRF